MSHPFAHLSYNFSSRDITLKVFDGPKRLAEVVIRPEALALLVADGARILTTIVQNRREMAETISTEFR
jgi:hypothetical protein